MSSTRAGADQAGLTWLPDPVRAVLLVSAEANGRWGGVAAAELAEMVGRIRSHTLLVNTSPGSEGPDRPLDCQTVPGLTDAMLGRHAVKEIVVAPPGRSFLFVPAGLPANPLPDLVRLAPFSHLVRAAAKGGTLLLYASESDVLQIARLPEQEGFAALFDALVMLGASAPAVELADWPAVIARVEKSEKPRPSAPGTHPAGFTRPKGTPTIVAGREVRPSPESPVQRALRWFRRGDRWRGARGVLAVWLVAVLAVWLIWQGLSGWPAFDGDESTPPVSAVSEGETGDADPGSEASEGEAEAMAPQNGPSVTPNESPPETADAPAPTELAYSVLVGSYLTWDDAQQRRQELVANADLAFVAPTVVRGRLYYRVFSGAFEDRTQAEVAMRILVESELKERERAWDVRPVRLAFSVTEHATEREAVNERDRLHEEGLPAYVLPVDAAPAMRYRLYSGAFESEAAAAALDSILQASGVVANLESRRGRTR